LNYSGGGDLNILDRYRESAIKILQVKSSDSVLDLNNALRRLATIRSILIYNTIIESEGSKIFQGPFKGMNFFSNPADISEGCLVPKIIGSYESELHPFIDDLKINKPNIIINIGAAEGYYSVGLKLLLQDTDVFAYDIDPKSKEKTLELSKLNNVNISCRDEFSSSELNDLEKKDIFILCDIEGAELNLFNEDEIIKYKNCRLIIETHSTNIGHSKDILPNLFSKTHNIKVIEQTGSDSFEVPEIISQSNHLDILLSKWECRTHPTPWLSLTPKNKAI
jgi:hypothetical protein